MTENTLQAAADSLASVAMTALRELKQTSQRLRTRTFQTKSLESMLLSADVQSRNPMKKVLPNLDRKFSGYACAEKEKKRRENKGTTMTTLLAGAWTSLLDTSLPGTHYWQWHFCLDGGCSPHACRVSHRVMCIHSDTCQAHCSLQASTLCPVSHAAIAPDTPELSSGDSGFSLAS